MKQTEDQTSANELNETLDNSESAAQDRAILKKKLKKFLLIGGATLAATAVVAVIVAKTRGSNLPEITDILPE